MYLETMQQIFSNTSKLMMDVKSSGNMVYLPLDKILSQGDSAQQKPQTAMAEPMPTVEVRASRDARPRDSRERESR
ncbi:MAG: protease modulator HflK, partial [Burkholderiales bacterium]|nr:protease modulator HflK [Burkholderiales bacterium]